MRSKLASTAIVFFATYVLYLSATNRLIIYIHPRYIAFTTIFAVIAFVLVVVSFIHQPKENHTHPEKFIGYIPLLFIAIIAIIQPARTLTSATIDQRLTDTGSLVTSAEATPLSNLFVGSSKGLSISDWYRLLATNTEPSFYKNKPVIISGFTYDVGLGPEYVWLARFTVTCCAVDAQPIGVVVAIDDWQTTYGEDTWLEIEGMFKQRETTDGTQLVLIPDNIRPIDTPENPYAK